VALKEYELNGYTFLFDEKEAPEGAVPVKAATPANKGRKPATK
jgi:hypothetical protein